MEELTELAKKQLRFQKIITGLLAALLVVVLAVGIAFVSQVKQMSTAIKSSAESLQEIDVDAINQTVSGTQELLESVDQLSEAIDQVTVSVEEFHNWIDGLFGRE